uniref:TatD family deoxyribonuclease n=1 Tax=Desulfobacca acetoxidans TaxID=60893 RepID=A0A7V6DQK0_9BACT
MLLHLADAHAHLDEPELRHQQEAVLSRARKAGVRLVVNVGISQESSRQVVASAARYAEVFAAVGVHPHGAASMQPEDLTTLARLAAHPKVVAVGEIGLDFYRRRSPEKVQEHWFREQLALAHTVGKPVVIHTREATADTLRILQEERRHLLGGIMHCFQGDPDDARAFLDLGFFLSFSGVLTFPKAEPLRRAAQKVPLDRVLVETDCPYLAPQPWRGKVNEPAYVAATAAALAEVHGLTLEQAARRTWQNTLAAFRVDEKEVTRQIATGST